MALLPHHPDWQGSNGEEGGLLISLIGQLELYASHQTNDGQGKVSVQRADHTRGLKVERYPGHRQLPRSQ